MIRFVVKVLFCAPRVVLASFLVFTLPLMGWILGHWEDIQRDRIVAEQKRMGLPTGLRDLQGDWVNADEQNPVIKTLRGFKLSNLEYGGENQEQAIEQLKKNEKVLATWFSDFEKARMEGQGNGPHYPYAIGEEVVFKNQVRVMNYIGLRDAFLGSAGFNSFKGDPRVAANRLLDALWLCDFIGNDMDDDIPRFGDVQGIKLAMSNRVTTCCAANMLSLKWNNIQPSTREKYIELIGKFDDERDLATLFSQAMAFYYDRLNSWSKFTIRRSKPSGGFTADGNLAIDMEAWRKGFILMRPMVSHMDRLRQQTMLDFQKKYSQMDSHSEGDTLSNQGVLESLSKTGQQKYNNEFYLIRYRGYLAFFRMTAINLACQLYRAEKDRFPTQLEELTPEYLDVVPKNPFGKDWEYEPGEYLRYQSSSPQIIDDQMADYAMFSETYGYIRMKERKEGEIMKLYLQGEYLRY